MQKRVKAAATITLTVLFSNKLFNVNPELDASVVSGTLIVKLFGIYLPFLFLLRTILRFS